MPSRARRRAKKRAQATASAQPKHQDDTTPSVTASNLASLPPPAVPVGVSTSPSVDAALAGDEPVSRSEFMRLRAELEEMRAKHSATLAAHDAAMNEKNNEIRLLSSQVEQFRADIAALQDDLKRAEARARIAKSVEQCHKASEAALQKQLEATQAELAKALVAANGVVASIDASTPSSSSERLQTNTHHTAAAQAAKQAQSAERMATFEDQLRTLRESINSGAAERQSLLAALANAEQRVEALTAEKADLEGRLLAPLNTPVANRPQPVLASPAGSPITPQRLSISPQIQSRAKAVAPAKGPLAALVDFLRRALTRVMALFSPTRSRN